MRAIVSITLATLTITLLPASSHAAWPSSPFTNVPVNTATNSQYDPKVDSDGAGGVIVCWVDFRNNTHNDIYAQHVLASGANDPVWPAGGLAVCTAAEAQENVEIVSDGAGGAIVTWQDFRNAGQWDVYAQHVLASGVVDPAWPADGRVLHFVGSAFAEIFPTIASDGAGGAIVTWMDFNGSNYDIYANHVLASGGIDPAWPLDGRALCNATNNQSEPTIVTDGAGGAIVTWQDTRSGTDDIYAQHVLSTSVVDPGWPVNGRALSTAANSQQGPKCVSDGAGGAIVTWRDFRGGANYDVYAQHVLSTGLIDPGIPGLGRALCTAVGNQLSPTIASDGAGGAIVTWQDFRSGTNEDIYAQHLLAWGQADPAWPADGRALCTAFSNQYEPSLVPDGKGGAIVTWYDFRNSTNYDVYAQHVHASGSIDFAWPVDGRVLSTAADDQQSQVVASDGAGGAIVAWVDYRGSSGSDIYAQRVEAFGRLGNPESVIAGVQDVPHDDGGHVKVSWSASYLDALPFDEITSYEVWRSIPPALAQAARGQGALMLRAKGRREAPRSGEIRTTVNGTATIYWEYVGSQPARRFAGYSYNLATTGDSVAAGIPVMQVQILAIDGDGYSMWASSAASGYSVDNLAPAAPAPFTGQFAAGTTHLHWNPNIESDLAGYRLYRGDSLAFVPGPGTLVAALSDTGYADAGGTPHFYKLTAVDVHGNESPVATLAPSGTAGVDPPTTTRELSFAPPSPNPAGVRTALRYALPRASLVRLALYDAAGRLVRELARGARAAGEHSESWDLRGADGRAAGPGLYFARLDVDGHVLVRRVAITR